MRFLFFNVALILVLGFRAAPPFCQCCAVISSVIISSGRLGFLLGALLRKQNSTGFVYDIGRYGHTPGRLVGSKHKTTQHLAGAV